MVWLVDLGDFFHTQTRFYGPQDGEGWGSGERVRDKFGMYGMGSGWESVKGAGGVGSDKGVKRGFARQDWDWDVWG